MGGSQTDKTTSIRLSHRFSEAFNRFREQVRERAYQLSQVRNPTQADPMTDWLEAEAELSQPVQLEVKEQRRNTVVEVRLKDFSPEEIEIEVAGNTLQIFGTHNATRQAKKGKGEMTIATTQTFFQSVPLIAPVDLDHSHAKLFKNGKLKVVLPKKMEREEL